MFAVTLTRDSLDWFKKLPDGRIQSWKDLVAKFSQHFSQQRKYTRDPSKIKDVVQKDNEFEEDFINRFNNESLNIDWINEDMLRGAFWSKRLKQRFDSIFDRA